MHAQGEIDTAVRTTSKKMRLKFIHGGESRDILHIYSDRTGKHIRHYFFNAE